MDHGVLALPAKAAVNDSKVRNSLVKIQRDYQVLPQLIKRMENSTYTIAWVVGYFCVLYSRPEKSGVHAY